MSEQKNGAWPFPVAEAEGGLDLSAIFGEETGSSDVNPFEALTAEETTGLEIETELAEESLPESQEPQVKSQPDAQAEPQSEPEPADEPAQVEPQQEPAPDPEPVKKAPVSRFKAKKTSAPPPELEDVGVDSVYTRLKYMGSVTVHSHLEACGIINDHLESCFRYKELLSCSNAVRKRREQES